jgi:4-aminobutyrate aminotransferase-like enzyme
VSAAATLFDQAERLKEHTIVGDIRGKGLMMGIEFVEDKGTMDPFDAKHAVYARVVATALRNGLIVYPGHGAIDGTRGDHISLYPPLTVTEAEIDEAMEILDASITEVETGLNS